MSRHSPLTVRIFQTIYKKRRIAHYRIKTPAAFKPSAVPEASAASEAPAKASAVFEIPAAPKSCSLQHSISTLLRNGLAITFSLACPHASASISIPTTSASGKRCAIMSEISPVPEPMSRIRLPPCAHAPSKTPSVPTFMAHRSCSISNCLNRKLPINSSVSIQKKTKPPPIYFIANSRKLPLLPAKSSYPHL